MLSPGTCGYQETADSLSRATCRVRILRDNTLDSATFAPSDCAYQETQNADSLRACLLQGDSVARNCPVILSWRVHQSDGFIREAEWRRCGKQDGAYVGDSIVWPVHYLVLRQDSLATSRPVYLYSNREDPGVAGLDTVAAIDLDGDGSDELMFVNRIYGTGAMFEFCALAVVSGRLKCWSGPDFPDRAAFLGADEVLMKGWMLSSTAPSNDRDSIGIRFLIGKSLWFDTPVYRQGDPNCCPSAGASLFVEAKPRKGRFERGLVLRTREDSSGAILGVDTLLR